MKKFLVLVNCCLGLVFLSNCSDVSKQSADSEVSASDPANCQALADHWGYNKPFQMCSKNNLRHIVSCWISKGDTWHGAIAKVCAATETCVGSGAPNGVFCVNRGGTTPVPPVKPTFPN